MNDFYTFIIASTINTKHTNFSSDQRFIQTINTIESIRQKCPNVKILIADNSTIPISKHQKDILTSRVDHYVDYQNNFFTEYVNQSGRNKGMNELFQCDAMIRAAQKHNLVGKRIFKISGRYLLSDKFDIHEYEKVKYYGKYAFRELHWLFNMERPVGTGPGDVPVLFYNTALWSMCSSLIDNFNGLLPTMFLNMMYKDDNIEITFRNTIPKDKLISVDPVGGHGPITFGEWTSF